MQIEHEHIHTAIRNQLNRKRAKYRLVSIEHLSEVQNEMEKHRRRGEIKEHLYQDYLNDFQFNFENHFPNAKSIFIVAIPEPQMSFMLVRKQGTTKVIVPPTYIEHKIAAEEVSRKINAVLNPYGFRCEQAFIPLKMLATHSGLAKYGKNNIAYLEEMGSFLGLAAYYSDLPVVEEDWEEPQMMSACQNCQACLKSCPTGAIDADSFLIHAEKCLTFFNENIATFPTWIKPHWHNCLVGCMRCQFNCPQNRHVKNWIKEKGTFTSSEVDRLLIIKNSADLHPLFIDKLEANELEPYLNVLGRNINALLLARGLNKREL